MTKLKLLVVDDEVDFAEFVADVAENMDFNVISTADPTEVETLFLQDWNIIVLDLFMPHIDGIELLRLVSKSKSSASIVLMSGKDKGVLNSAQKIAEEQEITVLGVLQKPFFAKQLEVVLAKYVDQSFKRKQGSFLLPSAQQISSAIENKELFLVYQPQINITNRKIIGVEALVRWKHPVRGLIPPGIFIPIAEDNDLIKDISTFVTKTSIRQQAEWSRNGINLRMSINMSPKILTDLDMPEKLSSCVNEMGADIKNIVIEVTETALMSDVVRYMDILARLKMKGFNLSIDDFGTGYSSLQQLIRAPFNELKIDQAFIKNLDTDEECKTITEISIMLAHKLGMTVVAEGIETESVWNILRQLKCDEGQGYWMAKPMLPEEIEAWKQNWDKT
jgi:EAL domain-containing protein (putative c-di-GMP-specific phosphodiesterase class I)/AmiR/NasT family two-component response regulator